MVDGYIPTFNHIGWWRLLCSVVEDGELFVHFWVCVSWDDVVICIWSWLIKDLENFSSPALLWYILSSSSLPVSFSTLFCSNLHFSTLLCSTLLCYPVLSRLFPLERPGADGRWAARSLWRNQAEQRSPLWLCFNRWCVTILFHTALICLCRVPEMYVLRKGVMPLRSVVVCLHC